MRRHSGAFECHHRRKENGRIRQAGAHCRLKFGSRPELGTCSSRASPLSFHMVSRSYEGRSVELSGLRWRFIAC